MTSLEARLRLSVAFAEIRRARDTLDEREARIVDYALRVLGMIKPAVPANDPEPESESPPSSERVA